MYDIYRDSIIFFDKSINPSDTSCQPSIKYVNEDGTIPEYETFIVTDEEGNQREIAEGPEYPSEEDIEILKNIKRRTTLKNYDYYNEDKDTYPNPTFGEGYVIFRNIIPDNRTIRFAKKSFSTSGKPDGAIEHYSQNILEIFNVPTSAITHCFSDDFTSDNILIYFNKDAEFNSITCNSGEFLKLPRTLTLGKKIPGQERGLKDYLTLNFNTSLDSIQGNRESYSLCLTPITKDEENNVESYDVSISKVNATAYVKLDEGLESDDDGEISDLLEAKSSVNIAQTLRLSTDLGDNEKIYRDPFYITESTEDPLPLNIFDRYYYGANGIKGGAVSNMGNYADIYAKYAKNYIAKFENKNTFTNFVKEPIPLVWTNNISPDIFGEETIKFGGTNAYLNFVFKPYVFCNRKVITSSNSALLGENTFNVVNGKWDIPLTINLAEGSTFITDIIDDPVKNYYYNNFINVIGKNHCANLITSLSQTITNLDNAALNKRFVIFDYNVENGNTKNSVSTSKINVIKEIKHIQIDEDTILPQLGKVMNDEYETETNTANALLRIDYEISDDPFYDQEIDPRLKRMYNAPRYKVYNDKGILISTAMFFYFSDEEWNGQDNSAIEDYTEYHLPTGTIPTTEAAEIRAWTEFTDETSQAVCLLYADSKEGTPITNRILNLKKIIVNADPFTARSVTSDEQKYTYFYENGLLFKQYVVPTPGEDAKYSVTKCEVYLLPESTLITNNGIKDLIVKTVMYDSGEIEEVDDFSSSLNYYSSLSHLEQYRYVPDYARRADGSLPEGYMEYDVIDPETNKPNDYFGPYKNRIELSYTMKEVIDSIYFKNVSFDKTTLSYKEDGTTVVCSTPRELSQFTRPMLEKDDPSVDANNLHEVNLSITPYTQFDHYDGNAVSPGTKTVSDYNTIIIKYFTSNDISTYAKEVVDDEGNITYAPTSEITKYYYRVYQIVKNQESYILLDEAVNNNLDTKYVTVSLNDTTGKYEATLVEGHIDETPSEENQLVLPSFANGVILEVNHITEDNSHVALFAAQSLTDLGLVPSGKATVEYTTGGEENISGNTVKFFKSFIDTNINGNIYSNSKYTLPKLQSGPQSNNKFYNINSDDTSLPSILSPAPSEKLLFLSDRTESKIVYVPLTVDPITNARALNLRISNLKCDNGTGLNVVSNHFSIRLIGYTC